MAGEMFVIKLGNSQQRPPTTKTGLFDMIESHKIP